MNGQHPSQERSADDRLALYAVIIGTVVAFVWRRQPMLLGTGASLGLGGVFLGLRGERTLSGRSWLRAALMVTVVAIVAGVGLEWYQEWILGQWLSEGPGAVHSDDLRRMNETVVILRVSGLASSLALLLGAFVNRLS
jgi:hypothetical protein